MSWKVRLMKENEFSRLGKLLVSLILIILLGMAGVSAIQNTMHGVVPQPRAFIVVLIGFLCFAFAKISIIRTKKFVSFGTQVMTDDQANFYRLGYYLMALGFIFTFA